MLPPSSRRVDFLVFWISNVGMYGQMTATSYRGSACYLVTLPGLRWLPISSLAFAFLRHVADRGCGAPWGQTDGKFLRHA